MKEKLRRAIAFRFKTLLIALAETLEGKVDWLWVDCFDLRPAKFLKGLQKRLRIKVCLVSPELQGGTEKDFSHFVEWAKTADAICTKKPGAWKFLLGAKV